MVALVRSVEVLVTILAVSACAQLPFSPSEDTAADVDVAVTVAPVVGGKPSAECAWPSTVDISGCTGTLIHPRIVTTAAHCLTSSPWARGGTRVTFTAGSDMPGSFSVDAECKSGSRGFFGGGVGPDDWGYCVLPEDPRIAKLQVTPPLVGCEAERFLKPGASAWVVGFGTTASGLNDNGIKREVEVKVNRVDNGMIDIGDKDVGACHGDSGGPLYVRLADGVHDWGYRVAGSTSGAGGNCDCSCSTVYVNIAQHVKAIEENEGIDVTPCTDAEGNWDPGEDCKAFQSDPQNATGTYPDCHVAVTMEPIASCGEPMPSDSGAAGAGPLEGGAGSSGSPAMTASAAGSAGLAGNGGTPGMFADGAGTGSIDVAGSAAGATSTAVPPTGRGLSEATAGRGVGVQQRATQPVGTQLNGVQAPGSATGFGIQPQPEAMSSEGCQVTRVAARGRSFALAISAALFALLVVARATSRRSRKRHAGRAHSWS